MSEEHRNQATGRKTVPNVILEGVFVVVLGPTDPKTMVTLVMIHISAVSSCCVMCTVVDYPIYGT